MTRAITVILVGFLSAPAFAQQSAQAPIDELRKGGHVIIMRYGAVEKVEQPSSFDLANCTVQHRLSDNGRDQARTLGEGFGALNIPVGQVLSSPYCRALEFAGLAFGRVQPSEILLHPTYVPVAGAPVPPPFEERVKAVKQLLATPPAAGTNTVLISHGKVVGGATGFDMTFAEAAIFRPDGQGGTTPVVRVLIDEWR